MSSKSVFRACVCAAGLLGAAGAMGQSSTPITFCQLVIPNGPACWGVGLPTRPCGSGTCTDTILSNPGLDRGADFVCGSDDVQTVNRPCLVTRYNRINGTCIPYAQNDNNYSHVGIGICCY